jgi:hypothetical protein
MQSMRAIQARRLWSATRAALGADLLPDPAGIVSFGLLALAVCFYIAAACDPRCLCSGAILDLLPADLRRPWPEAAVEGVVQAFLFAGPPLAAAAGLRHLWTRGDSLLPVLTLAGGTAITLLNVVSLAFLCLC